MIRHKWYRWIMVQLGSRSFVKTNIDQSDKHVLLKGDPLSIGPVLEELRKGRYVEEWPPCTCVDLTTPAYPEFAAVTRDKNCPKHGYHFEVPRTRPTPDILWDDMKGPVEPKEKK